MAQEVPFPRIDETFIDMATRTITEPWYRFLETLRTRTGGDADDVAGAGSAAAAANTNAEARAFQTTTITAGSGLEGGGDLSANRTLSAKQDTGWTAGTGVANKGAFASYGGQTVSVAYVQSEAQQTDSVLKSLSERVLALEQALRNNQGIDG